MERLLPGVMMVQSTGLWLPTVKPLLALSGKILLQYLQMMAIAGESLDHVRYLDRMSDSKKKPKPQGRHRYKPLQLRLVDEMRDALDRLAKLNGTNASN